jgi:GNAT superfamily N-acetyltransferase
MIRELAEFERLAHEMQISADLLRTALFGERPVAAALLARAGDAVAGYAIYYRTFSTFVGRPGVFLEDVYVRPEFRQRGLGRALLEAVAKTSVENALRFYRGLGARVMDDWVLLRMNPGDVRKLLDPKALATE